jgi:hypothetical protein
MSEMNATSTRRAVVEPGGDQVVSHVGLHALGSFADQLGLGDALSARIPPRSAHLPLHDRGKVLVQTMLMLAGGGESCADIEHLRIEPTLFGAVPSDSTLHRTFCADLTPTTLKAHVPHFSEAFYVPHPSARSARRISAASSSAVSFLILRPRST